MSLTKDNKKGKGKARTRVSDSEEDDAQAKTGVANKKLKDSGYSSKFRLQVVNGVTIRWGSHCLVKFSGRFAANGVEIENYGTFTIEQLKAENQNTAGSWGNQIRLGHLDAVADEFAAEQTRWGRPWGAGDADNE